MIVCIESLTAKLAHSVYHCNIGVYSIQGTTQLALICFLIKRDVWYPASERLSLMLCKCRQAQDMCNIITLS